MPPVDPSTDQDFLKASTADQMAYLRSVDSDFAKASPGDQMAYLLHVTGRSQAFEPSHIGVGTPTSSLGYQYSTGYARPNDAPRASGGFIDRMTTAAGQALQNPMNFLPSPSALVPPLGIFQQARNEWQAFQAERASQPVPRQDPAQVIGNMAPAALTALVTHAADAGPNLATAARSEYVPSGVAHPIQGAGRAISALQPNLLDILKRPISSTVGKIPEAIQAGMGEPIRVAPPALRPPPAWQTQPQTGTTINVIGSTPEEIQANLTRMAQNAANRKASAPTTPEEISADRYRTVKLENPVQPPFPGPKDYELTRGTDPFTHPNAPKQWRFDQDYSTNVKQYGYDPDSQTLSVIYKRGGGYQFKATQQMFNEMQKAPSAGAYLHDVVEPAQYRGVGTHIGTVAFKTPGTQVQQALAPTGRPLTPDELAVQAQSGGTGVSPTIGNWEPPPELGAMSAPDYGRQARAATQKKFGGKP